MPHQGNWPRAQHAHACLIGSTATTTTTTTTTAEATTTTRTTSTSRRGSKMMSGPSCTASQVEEREDDGELPKQHEAEIGRAAASKHQRRRRPQKQSCVSLSPTERSRASKLGAPFGCLLLLCGALLSLDGVAGVLVHQVRFVAGASGRTDYALVGESLELTCVHLMKDDLEDIKQLVWAKDGKNFLRWRKNKPGLEVLSYTFKGHIDHKSTHSHLTIHNATIDMHGRYKCIVRTDLNTHENELDQLAVISPGQCRPSDWRISSDQTHCREIVRVDCRQMFPKPVSSCGLWNAKSERFIQSITLDVSEEPPGSSSLNSTQTTYRVFYADQFDLALPNGTVNPRHKDLLQFAGHLIFKCDILVPETSWRVSVMHKMFDFADGCEQDPLEAVDRMRANFSQYARLKLQQLYKRPKQHLDEIEMLASNLRYEILPPPSSSGGASRDGQRRHQLDSKYQLVAGSTTTQQQQQQQLQQGNRTARKSVSRKLVALKPDLNCWQKPRLGSLARLSCAPSSVSPPLTGGALDRGRGAPRLSGTNLLECRPGGWVPVRPEPRALDQAHQQQQQQQQELRKRPPKSRLARKLDLNQTLSGGQNSVDLDESGHNNDEDDDDDSSAPARNQTIDVSSSTTTSTSKVDENEDDARHNQVDSMAHLTPNELAALLPTCVAISTGRRPAAGASRDRLLLLDGSNGGPATSESTARNKNHAGQPLDLWFTRFSFSSSSAASQAGPPLAMIHLLASLAISLLLAARQSSGAQYWA